MSVDNLPPLDIKSFINMAVALIILGVVVSFWRGYQEIRLAQEISFFRVRRAHLIAGWRSIFLGLLLAGVSFVLSVYGEPVAYQYYPVTETPTPAPTATQTPTITEPPTLTLIPSITLTLAQTYTPTITATPHLPLAIEAQFESVITPSAESIFSPLTFARGFDLAYNPIGSGTVFANPVGHLYALFSYDKMLDGVQWTAVWYRSGDLVYFETLAWDGGTGGYGFSDWNPEPEEWLPGFYEVQIFVGMEAKVVGAFEVSGDPPTATPSPTPSQTPTATLTLTPTHTRLPTSTLKK